MRAEVLGRPGGRVRPAAGRAGDYNNTSEISSDEIVVPTRGQDWYDNGQWLELQRQTWTATSPAANAYINGAWNSGLHAASPAPTRCSKRSRG